MFKRHRDRTGRSQLICYEGQRETLVRDRVSDINKISLYMSLNNVRVYRTVV